MTDEQFESTIEWVRTDLLTLRSLLETPVIGPKKPSIS